MSASFEPKPPAGADFLAGQPYAAHHPFADKERLFVIRRPFISVTAPADRTAQIPPSVMRAHRLISRLEQFKEEYPLYELPEIVPIDSDPDPAVIAARLEAQGISDADAVASDGGDGITSSTNEAARSIGFKGVMLNMLAGYACDIGHMLFRWREACEPGLAMVRSRAPGKLHPLRMTIEASGQSTIVQEAEYCWSIGSALEDVARSVSSPEFRSKTATMSPVRKTFAESALTVSRVHQPHQLIAISEDGENWHQASDVVFFNGWRMAKHIRFSGMHLLEPGFGKIELGKSTLPRVLGNVALAKLAMFQRYEGGRTYTFNVLSHDGSSIPVQKDGEVGQELWIPSVATITTGVSEDYTWQAHTRKAA